jgi:AdoMet-dependent rRNA methyltransferase SPB1
VRKEKRKKQKDRADRRESRRSVLLQDDSAFGGFEVAPADDLKNDDDDVDAGDSADERELDPEVRRRRELIRQGMGSAALGASRKAGASDSAEIEIVPQSAEDPLLPTVDDRSYDSDHEEYDAHDRAVTMALGTLMLRKSRQKALVDASYNRFTWNDPKDLPTWFLDDEVRHNKPQLPVPTALLDQVHGIALFP